MYNRYIPNGTSYTRVSEPDVELPRHPPAPPHREEVHGEEIHREGAHQEPPQREEARRSPEPRPASPWYGKGPQGGDPITTFLSGLTGGKKNAGLSGILEKFKLDDIDTGDILLILILLFLFRDGDDMELVITLGLILLLGLGGKDKKEGD